MSHTAASLAAEFDAAIARAGLTLPEDRRRAMLAAYAELRGQIDLLRQTRVAAAEPSNIYRLRPR